MLRVRLREWGYILLLASILGFSISGFSASLIGESLASFLFLGVLTAFYIFLLSFFTTEINNRWLLKRLPSSLSVPFGLSSAFLSGLFGGFLGYLTNRELNIVPLTLSFQKVLELSFFLGVMTSSLGYLLYKLVLSQRKEEESRRLLLEEHLRNLEAQISPHFLFNTLNAIAELVHADPQKAESSIIAFSKLLRKSLYMEPFISLEDELELLKEYWEVISLRFISPIDLKIQVEENVDLRVPKFSLQVLVENALKHGLKFRGGSVKIRAYTQGKEKVVQVEDSGGTLYSLKEGVGIGNLRKRLSLCNGELQWSSEEGKTIFRMVFRE
jgi:LytS/YehU family sensor histidine kinase